MSNKTLISTYFQEKNVPTETRIEAHCSGACNESFPIPNVLFFNVSRLIGHFTSIFDVQKCILVKVKYDTYGHP